MVLKLQGGKLQEIVSGDKKKIAFACDIRGVIGLSPGCGLGNRATLCSVKSLETAVAMFGMAALVIPDLARSGLSFWIF